VVTTVAKPASLPPIVMVTRFVPAVRPPSWLARTPSVVAPPHATKVKLATACAVAQSGAYDCGLRSQLPLAGS
jgi:hypothetical protein